MRIFLMTLALAASVIPIAACAQSNAQDTGGPSPEIRAKLQQARDDARAASFKALSADHQQKVQAIVDQFNNGTLADPKEAASQIDAVLTADESHAVLDQATKMHDAMRAAFANGQAPTGAAGQAPSAGAASGEAEHHRTPDAGRFLLMVSASPDKLRQFHRGG